MAHGQTARKPVIEPSGNDLGFGRLTLQTHFRLYEKPPTAKLSNKVHRIWRAERFESSDKDFDYHVFDQAARLASHLIESPQAEHYFYAVFFGRNKTIESEQGSQATKKLGSRHQYASNKGIYELTKEDRAAVKRALRMLARFVTHEISDLKAVDAATRVDGTAQGMVVRANGKIIKKFCLVQYSQAWYDRLRDSSRSQDDVREDNFAMARLMVHELAHAANRVVDDHRCEGFFEDSVVAEAGFELEARIFGKILSGPFDVPDKGCRYAWYDWPSTNVLATYDMPRLCRDKSRIGPSAPRLPLSYYLVARCFDDNTWSEPSRKVLAMNLLQEEVFLDSKSPNQSPEFMRTPRSVLDIVDDDAGPSFAARTYPDCYSRQRRIRGTAPPPQVPLGGRNKDKGGKKKDDAAKKKGETVVVELDGPSKKFPEFHELGIELTTLGLGHWAE